MLLYGYDDKIINFEKIIKKNELGQAYLFYGEPEVGKFTFAKKLANFLENKNWNDTAGPLFDALILDPQNNSEGRETLGVEKILEAESFLYQRPVISERKTLIINDAFQLTREAQSALLKIVEEPPSKALIIFISPQKNDLFEALLSRLEKIYFPTLSSSSIKKFLEEKHKLPPKEAEKISKISFGRIGRAIKIFSSISKKNNQEQENDEKIEEKISEIILKIYLENLQKNYSLLKFLLEKELVIKMYKRYNLNIKLQEKVINYFLNKYGYNSI